MSKVIDLQPSSDRELVLARWLDASPASCYRCWTDPTLIPKWFVPPPYSIARAEMDVRPGGSTNIVFRSPEGQEIPNPGVYLEVIPNRKIVFTDAYRKAWEASPGHPFMTAIVTFEEKDGGTLYIARVQHWTVDDRKKHEAMGFSKGWGICADQLEALASKL
jgi:uncharacterized protein YndB with AHSA1/START domain